ncbi:MAG: 5-oxoprolinase subunit PxpB [Proteobacteria bacterium]|nr:5-oxoprolinase subunit PxpB [Pseudomonadota bacterium]
MDLPAKFRILPCGDAALTVEFGDTVDSAINARVLGFDAAVTKAAIGGVVETIPTYRSLFVQYDPVAIGFADLAARLKAIAAAARPQAANGRRWRVPVVYGGEAGMDLDDVARRHGLTTRELIARHAAGDYRIYMIGFTPGFAYLGGLDPTIATPRRDAPRAVTPPGAVMIGGVQACIQCQAAPSGWHVLGRTPMRNFHPARDPVFLMGSGDSVSFYEVPAREWIALERAAERGEKIGELVAA